MDDSTKQLIEQLELIKAESEWEFPLDYCVTIENAIKRIQMEDYMLKWIDENFEAPCILDIMNDDYCINTCPDVPHIKTIDCWKRFFLKKIGEQNGL